MFLHFDLGGERQDHEIGHPTHIQSVHQVIFCRNVLQALAEAIDTDPSGGVWGNLRGNIDTLVQGADDGSHIDINGKRHNGHMTWGTVLTGENANGLRLLLMFQLLLLTSLVPAIEFGFELLVRGLAGAPLLSFDLAWMYVSL